MPQLPMIPGWDGIHPLLIHFPLTLFFVAPVFVLFARFTKDHDPTHVSHLGADRDASWNHVDLYRV